MSSIDSGYGFRYGEGGVGGGGFVVPDSASIPFADNAARDAWATANLSDLIRNQTIVSVTGSPDDDWYLWRGQSDPASYDNTQWEPATPIIRGPAGAPGGTFTFANTEANRLVRANATNDDLVAASLVETASEMQFDKDCIFTPAIRVGSTILTPIADSLYLRSIFSGRNFAPVGAPFTDTTGTQNPMYVKLGSIETLPAGANQTDFSEDLSMSAGSSMSFVQAGAVGVNHATRRIQVRTATGGGGQVRLEIFSGTNDSGAPLVDQVFTLVDGVNTLDLTSFPYITEGADFFNRYTAIDDVILQGLTINSVFVPYNVSEGSVVTETRVLTVDDYILIAAGIAALTGNDRLPASSIRLDTAGFGNNFDSTITNLQLMADLIDNFVLGGGISPRTDEEIRDVIGLTLVAGTNVTIDVDDTNNTITINSTGGGATPNPVATDLRYGLSSESDPASVDFNSLTDEANPTDPITISTGAATAGQYFHIFTSNTHEIVSITDTVLQQVVYQRGGSGNIFTLDEDNRTEGSITYDSLTIGPLNAGVDEDYVVRFS